MPITNTETQTGTASSSMKSTAVATKPQMDLPTTNREAAWRGDRGTGSTNSSQSTSQLGVNDMLNEVAALGASEADDASAQAAITKVLNDPRYADIVQRFKSRGQSDLLADQMARRFIESARVTRYDQANPIQKLGYEMIDWAKDKLQALNDFVKNCIDSVKNNPAFKSAVKIVEGLLKQVDNLGATLQEFASDPAKREEFLKKFRDKTWKSICENATKAWESIKKIDLQKMMQSAVTWASDFENWQKAGKSAVSFLKSMCDDMGITQIVHGLYGLGKHLVTATMYMYAGGGEALKDLVTGNWNKIGADFSKNMDAAFKEVAACGGDLREIGEGAVKATLALTGLDQVIQIIQCASVGDWQGVAIAAVCLGAAYLTFRVGKHLVNASMKHLAKDGMRVIADRLGDEVVKEVTDKVGTKALQEMCRTAGKEAAQEALQSLEKEIVQQIADKGTVQLTHAMVKEFAATSTEKVATTLLEKLGVKEIVAGVVERELDRIASSSAKKIANEFIEAGYQRGVAMKMASSLKYSIGKRGGKAVFGAVFENELKDILEDGITNKVKKCFIDNGMKSAFEETWDAGIEKLAVKYAKHGFDKETAAMCKKAGREGFDEGLDRAVRKVVREGIDEGFKRFRQHKGKRPHSPFIPVDELELRDYEGAAAGLMAGHTIEEEFSRRRKKSSDDAALGEDKRKFQIRTDDVDYAVRRKHEENEVYSILFRDPTLPQNTHTEAPTTTQNNVKVAPDLHNHAADSSVGVPTTRQVAGRRGTTAGAPQLVVEAGGKASHRESFLESTRSAGSKGSANHKGKAA